MANEVTGAPPVTGLPTPPNKDRPDPGAKALEYLTSTPYACSKVEKLTGGISSHVYRGTLSRALQNGTKSVIIKCADEYLSSGVSTMRVPVGRNVSSVLARVQPKMI